MNPPHPEILELGGIDWCDTNSILAGATRVFDTLADPATLIAMVDAVADDPGLAGMCEGYDFMRKLVLHDNPGTGVRIRLHLYRDGFFDRPHNHRWSFASRILRGSYLHRIFGSDTGFDESTDVAGMRPLLVRHERPGSTYALHHNSVHSVAAEPDTISLLIRGPAAKDRFLIHDAINGGFFWVHGAAGETRQQRDNKRLTATQLADTIATVRRLLIDEHSGATE